MNALRERMPPLLAPPPASTTAQQAPTPSDQQRDSKPLSSARRASSRTLRWLGAARPSPPRARRLNFQPQPDVFPRVHGLRVVSGGAQGGHGAATREAAEPCSLHQLSHRVRQQWRQWQQGHDCRYRVRQTNACAARSWFALFYAARLRVGSYHALADMLVGLPQEIATESSGDGKRRQHGVEGEGGEAAMDSRQAMQRA
eukprot:COSAG05_NODE_2114_length_3542_cov_543.877432_3_plen_199_part_01